MDNGPQVGEPSCHLNVSRFHLGDGFTYPLRGLKRCRVLTPSLAALSGAQRPVRRGRALSAVPGRCGAS